MNWQMGPAKLEIWVAVAVTVAVVVAVKEVE